MTQDPVGKAIEDNFYGQHGVFTGNSASNAIGYAEYERRQAAARARGGAPAPASGRGRGYTMLGLFDDLLWAIPLWLKLSLAVAGAGAGYVWGGLLWPEGKPLALAGIGGLVGFVLLQLVIRLADFVVQLMWAALLMVLGLAMVAGLIWGVITLTGGL